MFYELGDSVSQQAVLFMLFISTVSVSLMIVPPFISQSDPFKTTNYSHDVCILNEFPRAVVTNYTNLVT